MKKILIVVDYQYDFASKDGVLSVLNGDKISDNIQSKINSLNYETIIYTFDTHIKSDYEKSDEKQVFNFPLHCEYKSKGWGFYKIKPICNISFNKEIENYNHPFEIIEFSSLPISENENKKQIDEYFFTKNVFNIWLGNKIFPKWFKDKFSKDEYEIEVVGLATDYCVKEAIDGFVKRGYKVSIDKNSTVGIYNINNEKDIYTEFKKSGVSIIDFKNNRKVIK